MADATTTGELREKPAQRRDIPRGGFVRRERRRLALRYGLIGLGAIVLLVGGLLYWLSGGRYITTDDAYVQANVLNVTTDVSGLVDRIMVREGQMVRQGQVLFRLDPTEFQIAIDQASANLAQTELQLRSLQADYRTAEAQVTAQQAKVDLDQATFNRDAELVTRNAVSRQQYDEAKYQLEADQGALGASQAAAQSALARLGTKADAPLETMPAYKLAAAKLADAQRSYQHSIVRAPFAGQVTQVNKLQPGQYLAAGTPAFGLVDTGHMWVAAEPKETALTHARAGQPATITVDTYPGHVWHGVLESTAPATDQEFAVLPAQNSSGNWVKVVQRVPLRVNFQSGPSDPPLSAGMSAEVSIDTAHRRTIADLF
jgi:membrane fusion protein (multidrug efflux system)